MTRQYASAGAIVVTADFRHPRTLLLDQVRVTGERQTVAAKGRLEPGEAPLAAALREVAEEAGVDEVTYAGYLGQQAYRFTDNDEAAAAKTVDWFLLAADDTTATVRREEGFTTARWVDLDTAGTIASHGGFGEYLRRAADIVGWRQQAPLPFSVTLDRALRHVADRATAILAGQPTAGMAVCGSAARGDFVDDWSDIDLIGWGLPTDAPLIGELVGVVREASDRHGVRVSLHFADEHARSLDVAGPLYDMKLQAAMHRIGVDVPVIAGVAPVIRPQSLDVQTSLSGLREFVVRRLREPDDQHDRARRVLSVACSAARTVVTAHDPTASLRLPSMVVFLEHRWPACQIGALLREYDAFRSAGATSIEPAVALAEGVPDALAELITLANPAAATSG